MDDLQKLERDLKRMAKFPTTMLTGVVKKAANPILRDAKANAPMKSGALKEAMTLRLEKSKTKGKKVYQITYSASSNDKLVKTSKDGKRSYYPASQEYGFITRSGAKVAGLRFMRNAADKGAPQFERDVINGMMSKIEKAWRGK